jgi:hypothetical protein
MDFVENDRLEPSSSEPANGSMGPMKRRLLFGGEK